MKRHGHRLGGEPKEALRVYLEATRQAKSIAGGEMMEGYTIGIGATCAICGEKIRTGEGYFSGWGDGTQTVHYWCNMKRLGQDQSVLGSSILSALENRREK